MRKQFYFSRAFLREATKCKRKDATMGRRVARATKILHLARFSAKLPRVCGAERDQESSVICCARMELFDIQTGGSDEEAVDEVARSEPGAHGAECFEIGDKVRA